jgi:hypothetical protein
MPDNNNVQSRTQDIMDSLEAITRLERQRASRLNPISFIRPTEMPEMPTFNTRTQRTITLGADPEFEIIDRNGTMINAGTTLNGGTSRQLGNDGSSATGEIRPSHGTAEDVYNSIDSLLTQAASILSRQNYNILSGAGVHVPLGGHVHFGGMGNSPSIEFIDSLNFLIAKPLRAISNISFREGRGYGRMSDHREQPHGFEYRSPCSWITHPHIAMGVLKIAQYVAKRHQMDLEPTTDIVYFTTWVKGQNEEDGKKVERFYKIIEKMRQNSYRLEDVKVFQAWRKIERPVIQLPAATTPINNDTNNTHTKTVFMWNTEDQGITAIKNAYLQYRQYNQPGRELTLLVSGAANSRSNEIVIFIPEELRQYFGRRFNGMKVLVWEHTHTIGLSLAMRADIPTNNIVDTLHELRRHLNRVVTNIPQPQAAPIPNSTSQIAKEALSNTIIEAIEAVVV